MIEPLQLEMFEEYLTLKGQTKKTRHSNITTFLRFAQWCEEQNLELQNIIYNDVLAYVHHCKQQGNKQRTLQINVGCIKHYYNFLLSKDEINHNPCSNVEVKGIKRKILYETFTPEELEIIYRNYSASKQTVTGLTSITHNRNKIILGLIIYQALRTEELARLTAGDIKLREGKIFIAGARRSNERELKLEAHQVYDLMNYINEERKMILAISGKQTQQLFISIGSSEKVHNLVQLLVKQLRKQEKRIKDIKQLRASVITNWLKVYGLRRVQHLAGHRYVSSTESYQANNMESLIDDVNKYHPDL